MRYEIPEIFISHDQNIPLIDVRSPKEFKKGHIKGAVNIALFSDGERHHVGTVYKKKGKQDAISEGLQFVGTKMHEFVKLASDLNRETTQRRVYCWRGGMRSEKMAWLFELSGMDCIVLKDGYKAYRNQQIADFQNLKFPIVLHGSTGCGKTDILHKLKEMGEQIVDLEALANHRGSAFGHLGKNGQPTSQQFHNNIHSVLKQFDTERRIWFEAESLKIGFVNMPDALWERMKQAPTLEIKVDRSERIKRLVDEYGNFSKDELAAAIQKISERLGGQRVKKAIDFLNQNKLKKTADVLLDYYDRTYDFTRQKYRERILFSTQSETGDSVFNAKMLLQKINDFNMAQYK